LKAKALEHFQILLDGIKYKDYSSLGCITQQEWIDNSKLI